MRTRLPENGSRKLQTWSGDRKTPLVPFRHAIEIDGTRARLEPAPQAVYYAVAHPQNGAGYFTRPTLHRVDA